ncbi:MAG: peptidoglycan synthetase [Chitinophagales bacterium]|nr:peptidoglycan synthetase [Chitinophagales bacterium]
MVVAGSHGKTSTTAMIMHVLKENHVDFDYLVGSSLAGFDLSVKISHAPLIILEGDEYMSSPIDMTSKFHFYHPHIAIITGVAWDHVNVFPTWESYVKTFDDFLKNMNTDSKAFLFDGDDTLHQIAENATCDVKFYTEVPYKIENNITFALGKFYEYALQIFGQHNMQNMEAARLVCNELGINNEAFYKAMQQFKGTAKRLEKIANSNNYIAYRDFAHSPSKLEATLKSVKEQYPNKTIVAAMELHTYSSTDATFLNEYKNTMFPADKAIVYMSAKAFEIKGKENIPKETILEAFNQKNIEVCYTPIDLYDALVNYRDNNTVFLLMSSGNFDGFDFKAFLEE